MGLLPPELVASIQRECGIEVDAASPVGGGCIANATRVETNRGVLFLKWGVERAVLASECDGLREMQPAPVPSVIALSSVEATQAWLLLQWLEPGNATSSGWESFGHALAEMHRRSAGNFGWTRDNFIGSLPQSNVLTQDWHVFWREQRILPQLQSHHLRREHRVRIDKLLQHVDEMAAVGNDEGPSLLHGDLWGGNVHALRDGSIAMIDPSTYYGHREVDLAMAALFGGFNTRFWNAYEESWPLQFGAEQRRHLYQLYYMLVHVNLFGASYLPGTMSLVERLGF